MGRDLSVAVVAASALGLLLVGCGSSATPKPSPTSTPAPTPTPTTSPLQLYADGAATWYQAHSETLERVLAAIEQLASSADEKTDWSSGSLSGFLRIDPNQSTEEVLAAMGAAARPTLTAEQLETLATEKMSLSNCSCSSTGTK